MRHNYKKTTCIEGNKKPKPNKTDNILNTMSNIDPKLNMLASNSTLNNSLNTNKQLQRLRDDIIEYQNKQTKFQKEIHILNQKLQSANSLLFNQNHKGFHKKNASLNLNSIKEKQQKEKEENNLKYNKKLTTELCTSYDILLDIVEMFFASKHISSSSPNYTYRDIKNDNASFSIDIYENNSINNDDDKRNALIEQIQSILLFKFNNLHSSYMFPVEKQIARIKALNYTQKSSNISSLSFVSNLSNLKNKIQIANNANNTSISSFDYANSIIHSPKFFRDESPSSNKEEQCSNIIMNESIIKEIAQNDSFALDEDSRLRRSSNINLIQVVEEIKCRDNEDTINPKQGFNIINTSFKDMSMRINESHNKKMNSSSNNDDSKESELIINKRNPSQSPQQRPSAKIVIIYYFTSSLLSINMNCLLMIFEYFLYHQ